MYKTHKTDTDRPFLLSPSHSRDAGGVKPQSLSWPLGYSLFPSLVPPFPTPPPAACVLNLVPNTFMATPGLLGPSPCRPYSEQSHLRYLFLHLIPSSQPPGPSGTHSPQMVSGPSPSCSAHLQAVLQVRVEGERCGGGGS